MIPLDIIKAFAAFAKVAPDVVEAFADEHPELREPPREDSQADTWASFVAKLDGRFPNDDNR